AVVPAGKVAWQAAPQSMPAGVVVTVPAAPPFSILRTMSVSMMGWSPLRPLAPPERPLALLNVAITFTSPANIITVQSPEPEHRPPLHPWNVEPESGVAVSVTFVPRAYFAKQVEP